MPQPACWWPAAACTTGEAVHCCCCRGGCYVCPQAVICSQLQVAPHALASAAYQHCPVLATSCPGLLHQPSSLRSGGSKRHKVITAPAIRLIA